ncbi:MAG: DUF882 domain-containing protein [Labilithrix sp.]|nr:DUF882 domain-containing protein [Labilithrix sp.]
MRASRPHPRWGVHARDAGIVLAAILAAGPGDAAPGAGARAPVREPRVAVRGPVRPLARPPKPPAPPKVAWASTLPALSVKNRNTNAQAKIRLYADDGTIDRAGLRAFMRVAASAPDLADTPSGEVAEPLDPRLVQLAFRAAYHFKGAPIVLVSATRKGAHGKHGTGDALDFQLVGVRAASLAAYARGFPCAGVGVYTHPKTQYIHLDVREQSFHWLDGSPPGVTWRERRLADRAQPKRDAAYARALDLPEVASK